MDHWLEPIKFNVGIDKHKENKNIICDFASIASLSVLFLHQDLLKEIAENAEKKYVKK